MPNMDTANGRSRAGSAVKNIDCSFRVQFPAPMSGGSLLPVLPAPMDTSDLHGYMHSHAYNPPTDIHTL